MLYVIYMYVMCLCVHLSRTRVETRGKRVKDRRGGETWEGPIGQNKKILMKYVYFLLR